MPRRRDTAAVLRWHGARLVKGDYLRTSTTRRLYLVVNAGPSTTPQAIRVLPVGRGHEPPTSARVFETRWRGR